MGLVSWDKKFSVGVSAMDTQHQHWFTILNNLHDAMRLGKGKELQGEILSEMIDYTHGHFRQEEELLEAKGYPQLLEHLEEHRRFAASLSQMEQKVEREEPVLTFDLMDSLKGWLENHILKEDMKYGAFIAGKP